MQYTVAVCAVCLYRRCGSVQYTVAVSAACLYRRCGSVQYTQYTLAVLAVYYSSVLIQAEREAPHEIVFCSACSSSEVAPGIVIPIRGSFNIS